ncbi:MAG: BatA domain-containing protein, partial [Rhodobacteraceae bacterium]|nr:BatA domain-containing protein [Paracoccaceae bacterium]
MPALSFASGWLLVALLGLPLLWMLLRLIPPAPVLRRFPAVSLLLGLTDRETTSDKTPWWLLLLRMLALAALIIGCAGPILTPQDQGQSSADRPALVLVDGGWGDAQNWPAQQRRLEALVQAFALQGREMALVRLTTPQPEIFQPATAWQPRIGGFEPQPWQPNGADALQALRNLGAAGPGDGGQNHGVDSFWLSDGLEWPGKSALLAHLQSLGNVQVFESARRIVGLHPPEFIDGRIHITARRADSAFAGQETVSLHGQDPAGRETVLASRVLLFPAGAQTAETQITLPAELRARLARLSLQGYDSAAAQVLVGDGLQRRQVALMKGKATGERQDLLSSLHYLRQALLPSADVIEGPLEDMLLANPDVLVLADVAALAPAEERAVLQWVEAGGVLLRFAGPRLAASLATHQGDSPLLPVRLRPGGRNLGGPMSWGTPKTLAPFSSDSPFFGLSIPNEVRIQAQVLAQPGPDLAAHVIARLADGTALVTRKPMGQGQVVLFHITANTEWSGLPLSGLFVQMLERLGIAQRTAPPDPEQMAGTIWQPLQLMDGQGHLHEGLARAGVAGEQLATWKPAADLIPGLYQNADRVVALNVMGAEQELRPMVWPAGVAVQTMAGAIKAIELRAGFLIAALVLLLADLVASLVLAGRLSLRSAGASAAVGALALVAISVGAPHHATAQPRAPSIEAAQNITLAFV